MDHIALISDLHGNLPALETTLADIRRRGIDLIFCLGDLVGKGPHSAETVDIARTVCAKTVKGNWDDFILAATDKPTLAWHRRRLGQERLDYLKTLPTTVEFVMSGRKIRLFHASPISIYHRVRMNDPIETHLAMFDNTDFTGDTFQPDVVGYGDIHAAYLKCFQQRILFNVGSVGNPLDLPQAAYTILEGTYDSAAPARSQCRSFACRMTLKLPSSKPLMKQCRSWISMPMSCARPVIVACRRRSQAR